MSVEALNHAMNYVIEAWMLGSGIYLGIGFTTSLVRRIREDLAAEAQAESTEESVEISIETNVESKRLAEVSAVTKQYAKAKSEPVSVSVSES